MATILSKRQIWGSPIRYVRVDYELSSQTASSIKIRLKIYYELKITSSQSGSGYKAYVTPKINNTTYSSVTLKGTTPYQWSEAIVKYSPSSSSYHTLSLSEKQSSIPMVLTFSCDDPADGNASYTLSIPITPIPSVAPQPQSITVLCEGQSAYCHFGTQTTITASLAESGLYVLLYKSVNAGSDVLVSAKTEATNTAVFTVLPQEKSASKLTYKVSCRFSQADAAESDKISSIPIVVSGIKIGVGSKILTATPYVGTANGIKRVKKIVLKNNNQIKFSK